MTNLQPSAEEPRAFIRRLANGCSLDISRHTMPLFGAVDGFPVQNGSGVLLQVADDHFPTTAAPGIDYPAIRRSGYYRAPGTPRGSGLPRTAVRVTPPPLPRGRAPKNTN